MAKDHPLEIFHHAVQYGLPSAIDEAAPYVVLYPVLGISKRLPTNACIPWVTTTSPSIQNSMTNFDFVLAYLKLAYNEATWRAVFGVPKKILQDINVITTPGPEHVCSLDNRPRLPATHWQSVKSKCLNDAEVWIGYLGKLSTFAEFEAQLQRLAEDNMHR